MHFAIKFTHTHMYFYELIYIYIFDMPRPLHLIQNLLPLLIRNNSLLAWFVIYSILPNILICCLEICPKRRVEDLNVIYDIIDACRKQKMIYIPFEKQIQCLIQHDVLSHIQLENLYILVVIDLPWYSWR